MKTPLKVGLNKRFVALAIYVFLVYAFNDTMIAYCAAFMSTNYR